MLAAIEQSIPDELIERIAQLTKCLVELTARLQQPSSASVDEGSSRPIEFLTENGFAIVRPWENRCHLQLFVKVEADWREREHLWMSWE